MTEDYDGVDKFFAEIHDHWETSSWVYKAKVKIGGSFRHGKLSKLRPWYIYRSVKYFVQRGRRGWSDRDVWGLDNYLARVIGESVHHLAKTDHGWPQSEKYPTFESFTSDLRRIADSFIRYVNLDEEEMDDFYIGWKDPNHGKDERYIPRWTTDEDKKAMYARSIQRQAETLAEMRRIFDVWPSLWD